MPSLISNININLFLKILLCSLSMPSTCQKLGGGLYFSLWGLCYGSWWLFCACTVQSLELTLFHIENRGSPFTDLYKLILELSNPQVSFFLDSLARKPVFWGLASGGGGSFIVLHIHHGWHYLQSEMTKNGGKKSNSPHIHWKTRAQYFLIPLTKDKGIFSIF